jgi:hypothetical protein
MIEVDKDYREWHQKIGWRNLGEELQGVLGYFATYKKLSAINHQKRRCCELNLAVMVD